MNETQIADLKQCIGATIAWQIALITQDIVTKNDLSRAASGIDSRFDEVIDAVGAELQDQASPITRLEKRVT